MKPKAKYEGSGAKPLFPNKSSRTRLTNGSIVVPDSDGRTYYARRMRDLISLHIADLGGVENLSEFEKRIIRSIAHLTVQLEYLEQRAAEKPGHISHPDLDMYSRLANTARRQMESLGLKRRARDVTRVTAPELQDYIASRLADG